MITNEVIILGKRVEADNEDNAHLIPAGQQRLDRFMEYYHDYPDAFAEPDAMVLCAGGSALLAHRQELSDDASKREGTLMADYLMQQGVPHQLIEVETESTSTAENFTKSMDSGLLVPERYTDIHRLGIVTHPYHAIRAKAIANILGFADDATLLIRTAERDSALREALGRSLMLAGVHTREELFARQEKLAATRDNIKALLHRQHSRLAA